ncbi:phosphatase [Rhodocytophaga rosea]|uniref:Phosphatase n=1 Tax=Rhodocytophaga rosea TaxID=2704465 RepID=A0A6C0GJC0_9BACT|nr:phosphatase [Rhodocytophaga rosea]QHT68075.1 phosphatase [Rhodocytophaga rosea]
MEQNRYAVIDLGTNTFHLLIAEVSPSKEVRFLHEEKFPARIGKGGISKGFIQEEAWERALQGLHHFRNQLDHFQVPDTHVIAMATSAIRNASNGATLVQTIQEQTRIRVQVISGDKEAEYIYYGVREAVPMDEQVSLIIDIGGGSVECIICNGQQIFWKQSFEIGAQRLMDRFMPSDPIPAYAVQKLNDYLLSTLVPLTNAVHQYAPRQVIGASGSFETWCEIHYKRIQPNFNLHDRSWHELPITAFYNMYQEILQKNHSERSQIPGMAEIRVDMIVMASCLVAFVLKKYGIEQIKASTYALKEGVLFHQILGK